MRIATTLAASLFLMSLCLLPSSGCAGPAPPLSEPLPRKPPAQISASLPEKPPPARFAAPELERAVHRAINRMRIRHDRRPLAWNDTLHRVARKHSRDMAEHGFFSHVTPSGVTPSKAGPVERARRFDFPSPEALEDGPRVGVGENLIRSGTYPGRDVRYVAFQIVRRWLRSPQHRRGVLFPLYREQGLGVAIVEGKLYVTQNLF